jgi:hypothetical protein
VLGADLLRLPGGLAAIGTLIAVAIVFLGLVTAAMLNRRGWVSAAGTVLVLVISGAVVYAVASVSTLSLVYLPAYDLFVISSLVAASVLPRRAVFAVAALNIALIVADYLLQPHAPDMRQAVLTYGAAAMLERPIALQVLVAIVSYLWVRGTDEAIRRADRAEEIAQLEHSIADQKRQLDIGVQQILQTHIRAANGDFNARAPLGQENVLWQIAASLNNLLARLQRAGYAEHQLRRTEEELQRLAGAIDDAQAGRRPIWPAPSGTAADLIIERISRGARPNAPLSGPQERGAYPEPFPPSAAMPPLAAPASQPWDPGLPPAPPLPPFPPPYAGPSQPMPNEWNQQPDQWGQQPDPWNQQPDPWGQQDQGRMPSNPWVFPPEADERS